MSSYKEAKKLKGRHPWLNACRQDVQMFLWLGLFKEAYDKQEQSPAYG